MLVWVVVQFPIAPGNNQGQAGAGSIIPPMAAPNGLQRVGSQSPVGNKPFWKE